MAKTATFLIEINGLKESISAVESLNAQLDGIEKRLDAISKKSINVNVSASGGGGGGGKTTSELDAEAKLQQQILATEEKIEQARSESYQDLVNAKAELKEMQTIAKANAAAKVNSLDMFDTNTMMGMKEALKSIKAEMQTMDVGSDKFKEMQQQANDLNNKLKEIEQGYGQFGRNVGNYASGVAEGMQKVVIKVGETEREFKDARDASRTLNNELKAMALNGQQGTKAYEELDEAVKQMNSTIKDVSKSSVAMDNLLDTMESIVAISSMVEGIGALFGIDDDEIQKSIQKLVALQNILQGFEKLNQQMKAGDGIMGWLAKSNKMVDTFAASLLKVDKGAVQASKGVKILSTSLKLLGGVGIAAAIIAITVAIDKMKKSVENMRDTINKNMDGFEAGAQAYAKAKVELDGYIRKIDEFKGSKKAEKQLIEEVTKKYDIHNKNIKNAKDLKEFLVKMAPAYLESVRAEAETMAYAAAQANLYAKNLVLLEKQKRLQAFLDRNGGFLGGPAVAQAAEDLREIENELKENEAAIEELGKKTEEAGKKAAEAQKKLSGLGVYKSGETTKAAKEVAKAEDYITKARIDAMKQGLTKTLAQLQLERNRRIEEAKKTGHMVAEQIELINSTYDRKELEARVKHHTDLINEEKRYAKELASLQADTWQRELDTSQMMHERELQERINRVTKVVGEGSESDRINALTYSYDALIVHTDSLVKKYAELRQAVFEADTVMKMFAKDSSTLDINGKTIDVWEKQLEDARKKLEDFYKENPAFKDLEDASIIPDIKTAIDVRLQIRRDYYKQLEKYSDEFYKKEKARIAEEIDTETQELIKAEKERHDALASMFDNDNNILNTKNGNVPLKAFTKQFKELMGQDILKGQSESDIGWYFQTYREEFNKWIDEMPNKLKKGEIAIEDYIEYTGSTLYQSYIKTKNDFDNFMEQYNKTYKTATGGQKEALDAQMKEWTDKMNMAFVKYFKQIESEYEEHENRMKVIQKQGDEQLKKANQESLESQKKNTIAYYSNMATEYERAMSSIRNKMGSRETNEWGIINYTKERQNLKTLQEANTNVMNKIAKDKEELVQKLKDNKITFEDFDAAMDRLNTMGVQAMDMGEQLTQEMKELPGEWWRGIDQWLQQIGQAVSSIIQSLAEINDAALQNEIDAIDKQTELLQEALDKQKEITQKHADDVNDIEDELASARGDRRQFLIDQLNAEMQAQRESLAQEKRMEKEKEALDKKRDDLEFQQKMNQWNASKLTAMINAALAISAAAVNTWPIPAIPMMALATAVGAAQIAAVKAAKPKRYASGGLLEGPEHKHGGIPVGNTGIEVEGKEYVIRKESSIPNIDLLSYINRKKRKLSLDDFIDFYSKNSIKGSIERVRPKYANGGQLPTLRNDIDINNRLITAIDDFANKPTYVEVVDIINKADNVRQVRALSGLKQN